MRTFDTGATRDTEEGKIDYEGHLSPLALEAFCSYMNDHRMQADGKLRASDNWQKGMPYEVYMKSMFRHFFDAWKGHRTLIRRGSTKFMITALCALMFNVQGYLHELIVEEQKQNLLKGLRRDSSNDALGKKIQEAFVNGEWEPGDG